MAYQVRSFGGAYGSCAHPRSGCGKTVLANYIANNVFSSTDVPGGVYTHFFQKSASEAQSTPSTLVGSILARIFQNVSVHDNRVFSSALNMIMGLADHFSSSAVCPFRPLWRILESVTGQMARYAVVVDGLDECSRVDEFKDLLRALHDLAKTPNSSIIVLSRMNPTFRTWLGNPIAISMKASLVDADIRILLQAEIDKNPRLAPISARLFEKVASTAEGMFLWARLMIDCVKAAPSASLQNHRLDRLPPGLNAVYDHFINGVGETLDSTLIKLRKELFLLLVGSRQAFSAKDINTIIALDIRRISLDKSKLLLEAEDEVLRLCSPLVIAESGRVQLVHASVKDYLLRPITNSATSPTTCMSVRVTHSETNEYLAQKCLCQFMLPEFASLDMIAALVRRNLFVDESKELKDGLAGLTGFYEYACLNWHIHLTAVSNPSRHTISLIGKFLQSRHIVTWNETLFFLKARVDSGPTLEVRSALKAWLTLLPLSSREKVPFDSFISSSYVSAGVELNLSGRWPLEAWLLRSRLAEYFNWLGDFDIYFQIALEVAHGTERLLGKNNVLTLRALSAFANALLLQGFHERAANMHADIGRLQNEMVGVRHKDTFVSLSGEGISYYFLARFEEAHDRLERASAGLLVTGGPTSKEYLYNQLYRGYALEQQLQLSAAFQLYEQTWLLWTNLSGPDNPATLMTQSALASLYRKKGQLREAEKHYTIVFAARQLSCGLDNLLTFDIALSLAYVYREMGRLEEASALLDLVSDLEFLGGQFERWCQMIHLRGLLLYDAGLLDEAVLKLQHLLHVAERNRPSSNREILWVRLSLAHLFRTQDRPEGEALALFQDVAHDAQEQDPTTMPERNDRHESRCAIIEKALELTRRGATADAQRLLKENRLRWSRREDFHILTGAPVTDTAWPGTTSRARMLPM